MSDLPKIRDQLITCDRCGGLFQDEDMANDVCAGCWLGLQQAYTLDQIKKYLRSKLDGNSMYIGNENLWLAIRELKNEKRGIAARAKESKCAP